MQLSVGLRPLPADNLVRIVVEYRLAGPYADLVYRVARVRLSRRTRNEASALALYLKSNSGFPALPEITEH